MRNYPKLGMVILLSCLITGFTKNISIGEANCKVNPFHDNRRWNSSVCSSIDDNSVSTERTDPHQKFSILYDTELNLGNDQQKILIRYRQMGDHITELGVDQNDDKVIDKTEIYPTKILKYSFLEQFADGFFNFFPWQRGRQNYDSELLNVPVNVRYRKSNNEKIWRQINLDFYFSISYYTEAEPKMQPEPEREARDSFPSYVKPKPREREIREIHTNYIVKNYFTGKVQVNCKNQKQDVNFALFDTNNNGVFNDPTDMIRSLDKKGCFTSKDDSITLKRLMQKISPEMRISMFAYPETILIRPRDSKEPTSEEYEPQGK